MKQETKPEKAFRIFYWLFIVFVLISSLYRLVNGIGDQFVNFWFVLFGITLVFTERYIIRGK